MKFYKQDSGNMYCTEKESVDLIITSPPYPMIKRWDDLFGITNFLYQHRILLNTWRECYRVLKKGAIMCVNIGDATRSLPPHGFWCFPNYAKVTMDLFELGLTPLIPIYWKKISNRPNAFLGSGFIPPNGYVSQDHEYIAIFRKGNLRKFEPKCIKRYASAFSKEERDVWFSQVWEIPGDKSAAKTSAFPEEIPNRLIRMFSITGDTVLDPFCGTGTTMKVADSLGRNSIGYDIEDYINEGGYNSESIQPKRRIQKISSDDT